MKWMHLDLVVYGAAAWKRYAPFLVSCRLKSERRKVNLFSLRASFEIWWHVIVVGRKLFFIITHTFMSQGFFDLSTVVIHCRFKKTRRIKSCRLLLNDLKHRFKMKKQALCSKTWTMLWRYLAFLNEINWSEVRGRLLTNTVVCVFWGSKRHLTLI